jgi:hypothetical protein
MIKVFEEMLSMYLKTVSPMCPVLHLYVLFITDQYKKNNIGQVILVGKCSHSMINLCRCLINYTDCTCYISLFGYCWLLHTTFYCFLFYQNASIYVIVNHSNTYIDNTSKIMIRWVWSQQHHIHHSSVYWWQGVISSCFI